MERKMLVKRAVRSVLALALFWVAAMLPQSDMAVRASATDDTPEWQGAVNVSESSTISDSDTGDLDIRTEAPSDRMYRPITADGKTYYAVIPVNGIYEQYVWLF